METITLKDCARDLGVSYESVRRQIIRYTNDLKGHVMKTGRTQYLDDFAVEFLKQHRRSNPITVVRQDQYDTIKSQKDEIDSLKNEIVRLQNEIINLKACESAYLENKVRTEYLLEDKTRLQNEVDQLRREIMDQKVEIQTAQKDLQTAQADLQTAKAEAESYHKSIFGFYRKK